jgi:hypothetical protein
MFTRHVCSLAITVLVAGCFSCSCRALADQPPVFAKLGRGGLTPESWVFHMKNEGFTLPKRGFFDRFEAQTKRKRAVLP